MPTLEEIAKLSNVSRSTVSRVINNDPHVRSTTREKVMAVVHQTNYRPNLAARSLATANTQILGLVVPAGVGVAFGDPFFPLFVEGVAAACTETDHLVMLWLADTDYERRMIGQIVSNGLLEGLIVSSMYLPDPMLDSIINSALPFVLIGQPLNRPEMNYVEVENRNGAREIITYLLHLGCRKIATITGPLSSPPGFYRKEGYLDALRARSVPVDPSLIVEADFTEADGYYAMQRLIPYRPEAVFGASDMIAIGAMRALREAGLRVPEDIAVVGFDDIPAAAHTQPPLTTVHQPTRRMGKIAVEMLIDLIEHPGNNQHHVVLPTELIIRESCGSMLD
jgi:LacI family transcriptional regulator